MIFSKCQNLTSQVIVMEDKPVWLFQTGLICLRYQLREFHGFHENLSYFTRKQEAQISTKLHNAIFKLMTCI